MPSPLLGIDALPTTVTVGGRVFPINHDFRTGIRFEDMAFDDTIPEETKWALALHIFYPEVPIDSIREAIDALLTFYRCGKSEDGTGDCEQVYSFEHDWDSIYAGFRAAYGIDLLEPDTELHWWRFRSMLAALPENSQLMRIIGYRVATITSGMAPEQRRHIAKMHALFDLPGKRDARFTSEEELMEVLRENGQL